MCECLSETREILDELNKVREASGFHPVPSQWLYKRLREECAYILPTRMVGNSRLWSKRQVRRIISALRDISYRPNTFRWAAFLNAA